VVSVGRIFKRKGMMSGRKSKQRGKSFELAVAKYMGMKRAHFERHDLEGHPVITVECKKREKLPKSVKDWYAQAAAAPDKSAHECGKIPVLIMGELNQLTKDALVVLTLDDFRAILELTEDCNYPA